MTRAGYYEASYPPSLFAPPLPPATGATAGIPGTWTPPGSQVPPNLAAVTSWGIVASPATAWTSGQFVQTGTAGAAGRATWTGSAWVGGAAPLSQAEVSAMTVPEVESYVHDHPDLLAEVYALEQSGKSRTTLLAWLKTLLDEEAAKAEAAGGGP
jgi:hypothetical protein